MTVFIFLRVICLFKLFNLTLVSRIYQENCPLPILWSAGFKVWPNDCLDFLSVYYFVPLLFLILLTCIFFLCLLVSLDKDFYILLIFSKGQLFCFIDSLCHSLCFYFIISTLSLIISCHVLFSDVFASFHSKAFGCAVKF